MRLLDTYQSRLNCLMGFLVVGLLWILFFPVWGAWNHVSEINKLIPRTAELQRADAEIERLENSIASRSSGMQLISSEKLYRQNLAKAILDHCSETGIRLTSLTEPVIENWEQFSTRTDVIELSGGFNEVLALVYKLEREEKMGSIVSAKMELVDNYKGKELLSTIYLQNVKAGEDD